METVRATPEQIYTSNITVADNSMGSLEMFHFAVGSNWEKRGREKK